MSMSLGYCFRCHRRNALEVDTYLMTLGLQNKHRGTSPFLETYTANMHNIKCTVIMAKFCNERGNQVFIASFVSNP